MKTTGHTFAYEGACAACGEQLAGCRYCRAAAFKRKGCTCPPHIEAIHIARSLRWRLLQAPPPATPPPPPGDA